ncbi:TPA: hypothetical protein ACPFPA_004579 [Pseudomonas aeruginosa]
MSELNKESVEQAVGDERAACNRWIAEQQLCQGSDISLFKLERNGALVSLHDLLCDAYQAGQARAALAQPSPALPPFAEKVLAKLRRFYDCAEDFESGGVDIGRHWLDLLTQLGLLNRVQRSPALWEISQHGEDLLEAPVAQAQHSVPGDIMRDAQRYRWLRDQQFYFSFSTENSDAGISSCTAGMSSRFKNLSWVDAAIDSAIAAAPGKEGV